jgi:hypothetical protein
LCRLIRRSIYPTWTRATTIASPQAAGAEGILGTPVDGSTLVKRLADGSMLITFVVWAR